MSEFAGLRFSICFPKVDAITDKWLLALLQECWKRGLTIGTPFYENDRSISWEDALAAECEFTLESDISHGSLALFIELAVQEGGNGLIRASNGVTPVDLHLILTNNDYPEGTPFSWIHFTIPPSYMHPPLPSGVSVSYLEAYHAFLFWCRQFCEILHPLFAFGYDPQDLLAPLIDRYVLFDTDPDGGQKLLAGHLPDMHYWIEGEIIQYVPLVAGITSITEQRLGYQIERLADDGLFIVPLIPRFTYTAHRGYRLVQSGDALRERLWSQADIPKAERETLVRQALDYYQRADILFQQCGDVEGKQTVRIHRDTLDMALNRHH